MCINLWTSSTEKQLKIVYVTIRKFSHGDGRREAQTEEEELQSDRLTKKAFPGLWRQKTPLAQKSFNTSFPTAALSSSHRHFHWQHPPAYAQPQLLKRPSSGREGSSNSRCQELTSITSLTTSWWRDTVDKPYIEANETGDATKSFFRVMSFTHPKSTRDSAQSCHILQHMEKLSFRYLRWHIVTISSQAHSLKMKTVFSHPLSSQI